MQYRLRPLTFLFIFVAITPFINAACFTFYYTDFKGSTFGITTHLMVLSTTVLFFYMKVFWGPFLVLSNPDYHGIITNFYFVPLILTVACTTLTAKGIPILGHANSFITAMISGAYAVLFWWIYTLSFDAKNFDAMTMLLIISVIPAAIITGFISAVISKTPNKALQSDAAKTAPLM